MPLGPAARRCRRLFQRGGNHVWQTARFCSASWGRTRSTEEEVYFPCGTPDPGIIVDGKVDLGLSLRRELKEETGLDMTSFDAEPGWTMTVDGALIAQIKVLRSNESATALRERILEYLASEKRPELADIRIVRGPGDFDPAMPGYAVTFLTSRFARG